MPLLETQAVMDRIRAEPEDSAEVEQMIAAATKTASNYMQRNIYATKEDLDAAIDAADLEMDAVFTERGNLINNGGVDGKTALAYERLNARVYEVEKTARGVVLDDAIATAIILITGTLYAHREDIVIGESAVKIPRAAENYLQLYRVMGV